MDRFFCELCMLECGNGSNFSYHVAGKAHLKRVSQQRAVNRQPVPVKQVVQFDIDEDFGDYEGPSTRHTNPVVAQSRLVAPTQNSFVPAVSRPSVVVVSQTQSSPLDLSYHPAPSVSRLGACPSASSVASQNSPLDLSYRPS